MSEHLSPPPEAQLPDKDKNEAVSDSDSAESIDTPPISENVASDEASDSEVLPPIDQPEAPIDVAVEAQEPTPEKSPDVVPYKSDDEASSTMRAKRQELGLQAKIEDDPRWQEAYNAALKPTEPLRRYGPSHIYDDLRVQDRERKIAEGQRNREAAREAANKALQEADPKAYDGYRRYSEYPTVVNDPDFNALFPNPGDPRKNRQRSIAKIDKWIAENPEKAFKYRSVMTDMRDDAVRGAADRGRPIPAEDERRLQVIKETGKKISSLPFHDMYGTRDLLNKPAVVEASDTQENNSSQDPHTRLDRFGSFVQSNPELYNRTSTAEDPDVALSFLHETMNEYAALLDADPIRTQTVGLALRKGLENQRAIAILAEDEATVDALDLRITLLDAMVKERIKATKRDDLTLVA